MKEEQLHLLPLYLTFHEQALRTTNLTIIQPSYEIHRLITCQLLIPFTDQGHGPLNCQNMDQIQTPFTDFFSLLRSQLTSQTKVMDPDDNVAPRGCHRHQHTSLD